MKLIYKGELLEVELLATGKRFRRGQVVEVTKEEAEMLKPHADFKEYREPKKGGDSK
jgi:hypothetical protein